MAYIVPCEADYKCPKGHEFVANPNHHREVSPLCPTCYSEFIEANVPKGVQVGEARAKDENTFTLM